MKLLIINSQGNWLNGWATNALTLAPVLKVLQQAGLQTEAAEVSTPGQLQALLEKQSPDTLIWANAYFVGAGKAEQVNLAAYINQHGLPMVGSGPETLMQLLEKDTCQQKMEKAGIPVPRYLLIPWAEYEDLPELLAKSGLQFPLVIKPTRESRSNGVSLVHDSQAARESAARIIRDYPDSNLIIESFLPGNDITCGYLKMGTREMLLPSYNVVEGLNCDVDIFSSACYDLPPEGEQQVRIEDPGTLAQLQLYLPRIVSLFDIRTSTRVDGRLDQAGTLCFFDINGFPGLNFPNSALVKQCFSHFPGYDRGFLFSCLIHSIIGDSLLRYGHSLPPIMEDFNLFNLDSASIRQLQTAPLSESVAPVTIPEPFEPLTDPTAAMSA